MKNKLLKYWLTLILLHLVLAIVPDMFVSNKITAMIPLFSIFLPLELYNYLNIPVWGEVNENMFMAPITLLGWFLVVFSWILVHYVLAKGIVLLKNLWGTREIN